MPLEVLMPKLGLTMTEGKVIEWKLGEGDRVKKGDILFVLETEKVAYEVEAADDGILGRILVAQDETVPVGTIVAYLLQEGESADSLPQAGTEKGRDSKQENKATSGSLQKETPLEGNAQKDVLSSGRVRATPLAKKIARELGIELRSVSGSGPQGRIVADDVKRAAKTGTPAARGAAATPITALGAEDRVVRFTGMRQTIAANMMAAKQQTAQTYMSLTVDASQLVSGRQALLPVVEEKYGARVTITDLMMKLVASGIERHPVINTRWSEEGVVYLGQVHMGMAMSVEDGLIVPVIRDINSLTIGQVAAQRIELIERVRQKKYLPDDIKGSTFTLSTLGMFGIESFTANINCPEAAILAVGAILDKPVARGGQLIIKPLMNMTLTYDHRIIDGAAAARFMQTLKTLIENPVILLA